MVDALGNIHIGNEISGHVEGISLHMHKHWFHGHMLVLTLSTMEILAKVTNCVQWHLNCAAR